MKRLCYLVLLFVTSSSMCLAQVKEEVRRENYETLKEMFSDLSSDIRPCPSCSQGFCKDDASNPVRCPSCDQKFHFNHGITEDGTEPIHDFKKGTRTYKVPGDAGYVKGDEFYDPKKYGY